ncbi:MAG: hypothetical protein APF76_11830 [Desulfitibacter sp. BRH_c19]|nr:MAG: hypothetical protein APF76_11830 [Desulfitibacter sp. BRH_c19]
MELKHKGHNLMTTDEKVLKLVFLSSYGLALITFITFVFAMIAVPISGANAPNGGILYPYLETIERYPRDYIWQYLAMFMICIYLINIIIIKTIINKEKQIYIQIASSFAIIATATLLINYYVQVNVVPISLMNQEYEGIALITQYNPHGIFIALEELGYIMMAISFGFLIPVFRGKHTNIIAVIYLLAVIIAIVSFIFISIQYGLDKLDRYEVIIISTTWLVLIINGILTGNKVRKLWKCSK